MSASLSSSSEVRDLYEESAGWYSEIMDEEIELPVYADTLRRLSDRLHAIPGPILDTSCGPGHMLARYHSHFDADRRLIGIDLSPRMVSIARAKLPTASVEVGDMCSLNGIGSASVAAVLSFFALHHVDDESAARAFQEWFRVLVPGGQLVVATWEGTGHIDYGDASDIVARRYAQEEVRRRIRSAGFLVDRCVVEPVVGSEMDAVYAEATRPAINPVDY